jgi:sugar phosphate isomerase/epimerase
MEMPAISRRQLLGTGATGFLTRLRAAPLGLPIGCQVYPVREMLAKDFPGTLRELAGIGYGSIEMCSPPGYERSGFGPLVKLKASDIRRIIQDAGLRCESCHYQFRELQESLDDRIAYAKELGLTQMVASTLGVRREATLDEWRRAADELNRIGERTKKAGLQTGFHNHNFEFQQLEGVLIYDELLRRLDANLVKMQFQVAVISLGFEAAAYFTKYPGRFCSIHLQDWSPDQKRIVAIGKGIVDWKKLFAAARAGGVKNYYVEVNLEAMRESYPYLQGLQT